MLKKIVIVTLIFISFLSIYFGSYLPLKKAQAYIQAINTQIRSLEEFVRVYDGVFTMNSPVGQEEVVKFTGGSILGLVSNEGQPEDVSRALVTYFEPYAFKNDVRHLLNMGHLYESLWRNFQKGDDFRKMIGYYEQVIEYGPRLPHALYKLFDLYMLTGNVQEARKYGDLILEYWPDETRIEQIFQSLEG